MTKKLLDLFEVLAGFRKFLIMTSLILIGVIFRITNLLSGTEFVNLLSGTVIAFFSANTIEHVTDLAQDWVASKSETAAKPESPDA